MSTLEHSARAVRAALDAAARGLVERAVLVDLVALAAVAGEHVLVIGPPGTAKSHAVRRVAGALGGRYFEYLLGRFTEPSELVGPVDLRRLREGVVETETRGMLPEAEVAFLDEVFLGSTAILNTLLAILNERRFRRGHTDVAVPLRVCVGAANRMPDDDALAAFADRFLLRCFVEPVGDELLEDLLEGGWAAEPAPAPDGATLADVDRLAAAARGADLAAVRPHLAHTIRVLRAAGLALTDRRAVKLQRLVAAAAALDGRTTPGRADLWPIVFAVPTADGQALAREALGELLADAHSGALVAAAAEAARSPAARAEELIAAVRDALAAPAADARRPRLEALAREIDAGFAPAARPPALAEARARLTAELAGEVGAA